MRSRLRMLALAVLLTLLGAACSSETTVVERADRAEADDSTASSTDDEATDDATADEDPAEDAAAEDEDAAADDEDDDATADQGDDAAAPDAEEQGFGLGGAEQLASLLTDCEAGNDLACDILFQLSAFDSIEETVALTCGGRSDVEVPFCTDGIETEGENLHFDIDSPGLDAIVDACETGDMTACDFLYFRSPLGSRFEELGNTCGGRTEVALPDCRTFFDD